MNSHLSEEAACGFGATVSLASLPLVALPDGALVASLVLLATIGGAKGALASTFFVVFEASLEDVVCAETANVEPSITARRRIDFVVLIFYLSLGVGICFVKFNTG
jgi:hypothetical protein